MKAAAVPPPMPLDTDRRLRAGGPSGLGAQPRDLAVRGASAAQSPNLRSTGAPQRAHRVAPPARRASLVWVHEDTPWLRQAWTLCAAWGSPQRERLLAAAQVALNGVTRLGAQALLRHHLEARAGRPLSAAPRRRSGSCNMVERSHCARQQLVQPPSRRYPTYRRPRRPARTPAQTSAAREVLLPLNAVSAALQPQRQLLEASRVRRRLLLVRRRLHLVRRRLLTRRSAL